VTGLVRRPGLATGRPDGSDPALSPFPKFGLRGPTSVATPLNSGNVKIGKTDTDIIHYKPRVKCQIRFFQRFVYYRRQRFELASSHAPLAVRAADSPAIRESAEQARSGWRPRFSLHRAGRQA
jgi:hypothetical protein